MTAMSTTSTPLTHAIVFDDGGGVLAPLTDFRASFDVRTGALTTLERITRRLGVAVVGLRTPPELAGVTAKRHAIPVNQELRVPGSVLAINGRCVMPPAEALGLALGERLVEGASGDVVAAHVNAGEASVLLTGGVMPSGPSRMLEGRVLIHRPWSWRTQRDKAIATDLELIEKEFAGLSEEEAPGVAMRAAAVPSGRVMMREPSFLQLGGRVSVHPTARVMPGSIIDSENGAVVIDAHAVVRPGAIVIGPCYIGQHSTVLERATIRGNTAIGPWCKVNGEVGGCVFQGYSNKAHDGYLGDTFAGEWVNLGAGTTTSNLLNTYGEIVTKAAPDMSNERTGETFLGATIGDHVKTAICTRLMTGSVLHSGGMFATTAAVSGCVAPFTWATDAGPRLFRLDKFTEVMRAAMGRRHVEPTGAYLERLAGLHGAAVARYYPK